MKPIRSLAFLTIAALWLAGCAAPGVPTAPGTAPDPALAEKAEQEGAFVVAAREFARLAEVEKPPRRQHYQLRATDNLIRAGEFRDARLALDQTDVRGLDISYQAQKQILQARLYAAEGQHTRAIRLLDETVQIRPLDPSLIAEIYKVRSQVEVALQNPIGAARNLIAREQYIVGKERVADNQTQIWKIIEALPKKRLKQELDSTTDPVLGGWLELALLLADTPTNPAAINATVANWRKLYPQHPAGSTLLTALASAAPRLPGRIERVALLLPLSSPYAVAAQALRDGFSAMDTANASSDKPQVLVYDIGEDSAKVTEFYQQAITDGAQLVVGPLGRDAAEQLVKAGVKVPTLLLSHIDTDAAAAPTPLLFQFGLPPEQEAKQLAERAFLDGHRQATVLYPQTPWGERMQTAFAAHWARLGGTVLASQSYVEAEQDHSEAIKKLLNIAQSEARKERLARYVTTKLAFESRPRQDVDFIFLAADSRRARLLKPQINFYHASRVPVYATSHVYSGKVDTLHDIDLEGVLFDDMPWMLVHEGPMGELRTRLQRDWPNARTDLDRLYALGIDSYAILPHLNRLSSESGARFAGVTGALSVDQAGRLQRQLTWAQFSKGAPKLLEPAARTRMHLEVETGPGG